LNDKFTGVRQLLNQNSIYEFTVNSEDSGTLGINRLNIEIASKISLSVIENPTDKFSVQLSANPANKSTTVFIVIQLQN